MMTDPVVSAPGTMDNVGRAEKIYKLLGLEGEDTPDQYYRVADVLCDLRHWCDSNGVDFAQEERMAVTYYEDECAEEEANDKLNAN